MHGAGHGLGHGSPGAQRLPPCPRCARIWWGGPPHTCRMGPRHEVETAHRGTACKHTENWRQGDIEAAQEGIWGWSHTEAHGGIEAYCRIKWAETYTCRPHMVSPVHGLDAILSPGLFPSLVLVEHVNVPAHGILWHDTSTISLWLHAHSRHMRRAACHSALTPSSTLPIPTSTDSQHSTEVVSPRS